MILHLTLKFINHHYRVHVIDLDIDENSPKIEVKQETPKLGLNGAHNDKIQAYRKGVEDEFEDWFTKYHKENESKNRLSVIPVKADLCSKQNKLLPLSPGSSVDMMSVDSERFSVDMGSDSDSDVAPAVPRNLRINSDNCQNKQRMSTVVEQNSQRLKKYKTTKYID